jgi:hypothetical protein
MSLRERCKLFLDGLANTAISDGVFPPLSPVDMVESFVATEIGRAASEKFEDSVPLALYFDSVTDRDEFVDLIVAAKPGMISKRWPS